MYYDEEVEKEKERLRLIEEAERQRKIGELYSKFDALPVKEKMDYLFNCIVALQEKVNTSHRLASSAAFEHMRFA
jgi:hypothetical protein